MDSRVHDPSGGFSRISLQSALATTNSPLTNLASERTNQLETIILLGS